VPTTVKNEYSWGVINWLAGAEVGNSSELSLARMTLSAGCATETHLHDNCEEAVYVISGDIECAAGGSKHQLTAGDHTIVRTGTTHELRNVGTVPAELVLSYSSALRDFTLAEEPAPGVQL